MKNEQNLIIDMGSFVFIIDAAIAFVLVVCFRWNFFIAVFISSLVGESFIRKALTRETSDDKNAPKLVAITQRSWWAMAGLTIAPVLFAMLGINYTSTDYYWGIVIIVVTLVKAGWIDWNHNRKLRAGLLSLACISWFLPLYPGISMFLALGFTAMAFFWSFADSLPDNRVRDDPDWSFEETSRNDQWRESDRSLGQTNGRQLPVTDEHDISNQEDEEDEARVLDSNKASKKQHTRGKIGNDESAIRTMNSSLNLQGKSTLRTDLIVICPKCKTRVLPKTDGTCPGCQAKISKREGVRYCV